ncbi:MAG TPA: WecB/TagA/CpsF family glycosyltransferase [bacterium]|nr:WecB/TagA/CpsF family glycosyltransferase [bacterium]
MIPSADILGVRVHRLTMAEAVAVAGAWLRRGGPPAHIVTAHTAMLRQARADPALRALLNGADLTTPDGAGILLVGRILGVRFPERVPGVDLADALCALCAREGYSVFLLGARPGIAEAAAANLIRAHAGLRIAGTHHGYFRPEEEGLVVARIREARPRLLLVALGFPAQELWIARHRRDLGVPVSIGVGGSLDVFAGRLSRAPRWVQRLGLEWAWRTAQEPRRRWRVVASIPPVLWLAARERLRARATGRGTGDSIDR